uniref:Uncharacterized protein n=1 Tax=Arundo donax TaxID=35708 RepID=A0A0A8YF41_ARUDO
MPAPRARCSHDSWAPSRHAINSVFG